MQNVNIRVNKKEATQYYFIKEDKRFDTMEEMVIGSNVCHDGCICLDDSPEG